MSTERTVDGRARYEPIVSDGAAPADIDLRFWEFHRDNPHVYETLVRLARKARSRGHSKVGIGMLFEVARWEIALETNDQTFRLNNNHRSRYARLIMQREPDLAHIFDTRELRAQ